MLALVAFATPSFFFLCHLSSQPFEKFSIEGRRQQTASALLTTSSLEVVVTVLMLRLKVHLALPGLLQVLSIGKIK